MDEVDEIDRLIALVEDNNRLLRDNDKKLRAIIRYINIKEAGADSENYYDFIRNVVANGVSNRFNFR